VPKPSSHPANQKIANMLGGDATPPGTLTGSLTTKNSYRPVSLQCFPKASKSNSSPIGMPQPASMTSWHDQSFCVGHASLKDIVSKTDDQHEQNDTTKTKLTN
jgi:hypothetical protein